MWASGPFPLVLVRHVHGCEVIWWVLETVERLHTRTAMSLMCWRSILIRKQDGTPAGAGRDTLTWLQNVLEQAQEHLDNMVSLGHRRRCSALQYTQRCCVYLCAVSWQIRIYTHTFFNTSSMYMYTTCALTVDITNPAWGARGRVTVKCSMRNACNRSSHIAVLTISPSGWAYFVRRALGNDSAVPMHASPPDTGGRNEASYSYFVM